MSRGVNVIFWLLRILLPCIVLVSAVLLFRHLMATAPQQERKQPGERTVYVEARRVTPQSKVVRIHGTGRVVPIDRVSLQARVSGEVLELHPCFEPGGVVKKGENILRIDNADYLLAQRLAQSALIEADYNYKVELGYQAVAQHEWKLLGSEESASQLENELALRKPHLAKVKAGKEAAAANLEQAQLNLSRTRLTLPFDALVLSRNVSVGTQVNTQSELGVFVDASLFRIEAAIPFDRLEWIKFPEENQPGAAVDIRTAGSMAGCAQWSGVVTGVLPEIERLGRMAQLLIDVESPLQGAVPLMLNSFVSVAIASQEIKDVFVVPSHAVHNGDMVYVVNSDSRVDFRKIEALWRDQEWLLTRKGLEDGDLLITSDVPSAVPNMKVELLVRDGKNVSDGKSDCGDAVTSEL